MTGPLIHDPGNETEIERRTGKKVGLFVFERAQSYDLWQSD